MISKHIVSTGLALMGGLVGAPALASVPIREEIKPAGITMPNGGEPSLTIWSGDSVSLDLYYFDKQGNLRTCWYNGSEWASLDNLGESVTDLGPRLMSASANGWEFTLWGTQNGGDPQDPLMFEFYDPRNAAFGRGPWAGTRAYSLYGQGACASWDGYGLDLFFNSRNVDKLVHKVLDYGSMEWTGEDYLTVNNGQCFEPSSAIFLPQDGATYVFGIDSCTKELCYFPYWGQTGSVTVENTHLGMTGNQSENLPAVAWANNKLHVFWRAANERLMHTDFGTGKTEDLGYGSDSKGFMGAPHVVTRGGSGMDIVFRTGPGRYYH